MISKIINNIPSGIIIICLAIIVIWYLYSENSDLKKDNILRRNTIIEQHQTIEKLQKNLALIATIKAIEFKANTLSSEQKQKMNEELRGVGEHEVLLRNTIIANQLNSLFRQPTDN